VLGALMYIFYGFRNSRLRSPDEQKSALGAQVAGSERA